MPPKKRIGSSGADPGNDAAQERRRSDGRSGLRQRDAERHLAHQIGEREVGEVGLGIEAPQGVEHAEVEQALLRRRTEEEIALAELALERHAVVAIRAVAQNGK